MSKTVTYTGILDMQVCVPKDCSDAEAVRFAEKEFPCGTRSGWTIRREGDPMLDGTPERFPCDDDPDQVHIMLDA